jgi:asparagine synthase (glutamine-hydrolysing)
MCGIFGFVASRPQSVDFCLKSLATIAHRGPDGVGVAVFRDAAASPELYGSTGSAGVGRARLDWNEMPAALGGEAAIVLGQQRLAIVELSALGHQPMSGSDGSTWIIFNGEIYNHVELRTELERLGHRFRGHSDTEVILASYRQWGVDCLNRFNGMWAFALVDQDKKKIFLARDRFGVKPLYLWRAGGAMFFGSEIKTFLPVPGFSVRPDTEKARDYLVNGPSEWRDDTIYEGVRRLGAGHMIYTDLGDFDPSATQRRWWWLDVNDSKESFDARQADGNAERYFDLLRASVEIRLRADVDVGSALSGGLDSSSVVYLAARALAEQDESARQHSFSSVYRTPGTESCDESSFIAEVANLTGVKMNTIEPRPEDVPEEHARMIWHMDTPPESTCMSGWHTFKLVQRTGIKVTLDGQGADEQLGGYLFYLPHRLFGVGPMRALAEWRRMRAIHPSRVATGALTLPVLKSVGGVDLVSHMLPRHRHLAAKLDAGLNAHLRADSETALGNLIHYADRTSMAFSVESRMPFLDVRLAEFLAALPEAYKIHRGWTKYVARQAFDQKLPDDIVWRKDKMGWPIPEKQWSNGPLRQWFQAPAADQARFDDWGVGHEYRSCRASPDITRRIRAVNLSAWARTFVDGAWRSFM